MQDSGRRRSRSRSPPPLSGPPKEAVPGPPLERHQGAQRDNRPAWMTKGVGVGKEMFGEGSGDLLKPGLTREDLLAAEKRTLDDSGDPFAEVYKERPTPAPGLSLAMGGAAPGPLPDQSSMFAAGHAQRTPTSEPRRSSPPRRSGFVEKPEIKPGRYKIEMCSFFQKNKCDRGANCTYAHYESELQRRR